jgi:predicted regulator of Ras-like GTPase activity (Roadblock/LC7/MglB family)/lipopolysaccharide biosynthesis regulator YciM
MANDAMAEVDELKKKLTQNPDSLIFVPLADAYRKAGLLQDAIDVCTKGLEKHPTYMSARVVLGRIYGEKDMLNEAVDELKKVEAVDVDNIMVHSMLGNVYLKKKMYAQAVEQFQRVLSLNPEDTETQDKLTEALSAKQAPAAEPKAEAPKKAEPPKAMPAKAEAARSEAPKAPEGKSDISKSMTAAELFTKKEEFDKAIEIYKDILDKDPNNMIVEERLRELYGFQDKKMAKLKQKNAEPQKKIEADKITTEDILDAMKKAVEDDTVDEKPAQAKQAPEPEVLETASKEAPEPPETGNTVSVEPAKSKLIEQVLMDLAGVEGVVGSFFLLRNGTIVASVLPKSINSPEIGNIIASIVEKTEASVRNMNQGKLNQVVISSESGQLLFTEVMTGVLFMIGNSQINVGKMRLILKDVIDNIKSVLS